MLAELQQRLSDIYQADCGQQVTDFLITDRDVASGLAATKLDDTVEETVLVAQDGDDVALSVYLDKELLERVADAQPLQKLRRSNVADFATVLEGVSHFNYLGWCADRNRSVTLLELELQAEIDKFVSTSQLAVDQQSYELARRLHRVLFDDVSFRESLDPAEEQRYRIASDYAARFCHQLRERIAAGSAFDDLRQFYRLDQTGKLSFIHSLVWN